MRKILSFLLIGFMSCSVLPAASENEDPDIAVMQQIRREILEDKPLSGYAQDIKIVAQDGKVKLEGTVRTEGEKELMKQKAARIVGDGNVTNAIQVRGE